MDSTKYYKLVTITKKKQTHRYREQLVVTSGEGGERECRWGSGRYELLGVRQAARMYFTIPGI